MNNTIIKLWYYFLTMKITSISVNLPDVWGWRPEEIIRALMFNLGHMCQIHAPNKMRPFHDDPINHVFLTPLERDKWEMDVGDVINAFRAYGFTVTITSESSPEKTD